MIFIDLKAEAHLPPFEKIRNHETYLQTRERRVALLFPAQNAK
jgi:hypothetical protein